MMNNNYILLLVILIALSSRIFHCAGFVIINGRFFHKPTLTSTAKNVVSIDVDAVDGFFRETPYAAAFITCSIKASSADVVAQYYENKENEELANSNQDNAFNLISSQGKDFLGLIDEETVNKIRRNFAFLLYGGAYQGCLQLYLIDTLYPMWFGTGNDVNTVVTKVLFDNFISAPLLCLPLAYTLKGIILGSSIEESLKQCWNGVRYEGVMIKYWSIWIPAQYVTFSVVPEHLRILFMAFVSFFWLIILSTISCKENKTIVEDSIDQGK